MHEKISKNKRQTSFTWTLVNRIFAVILIILGLATTVSLIDYTRGTQLRTSEYGTQSITSDAPLTAFHLSSAYAFTFHDWIDGHDTYETLQQAYDLLDFQLKAGGGYGDPLNSFLTPEFTEALASLKETQDLYQNSPLTDSERAEIYQFSRADLDIIEVQSYEIARNYFFSIVNEFDKGAQDQNFRSVRTAWLFIAFLSMLIMFFIQIVRKQIQENIIEREAVAESQALVESINAQLVEARESVEDVQNISVRNNDYLSTVNHELRTPLTSIIGYIEMLKDIKTIDQDTELALYLGVLDRNAAVLLDIVEDILTMSKYEAGSFQTPLVKVDVMTALDDQVEELAPILSKKSVQVNVRQDDGDFLVAADHMQLNLVLRNLLSNAIKYSPENSEITVALAHRVAPSGRGIIEVAVSDQGVGIPEDELPKVFTKFYRATNADSNGAKGTGLGLSIVQNIIAGFDGKVWVESPAGSGATFIVHIPEYLNETDQMINDYRAGVMWRAIDAISSSELSTLQDDCHQFGGAIGFYNFPEESAALLDFSHWLKANLEGNTEIVLEKKEEILRSMRESLALIEKPAEEFNGAS